MFIRDKGSSKEGERERERETVAEGSRGKCHIQDINFNQVLWLLFFFVLRRKNTGRGRKWERRRAEWKKLE